MMRSLWSSASGMKGQQLNMDNISNNLANVNTTGFKKSRVSFQDLMYQNLRQAGTPNNQGSEIPTGLQIGHGVKPGATQKMFTPGSLKSTSNPLDMAIEGDGFFEVLMPDGTSAYTRDGSFSLDSQGQVVTSDGYLLQPPINIPAEATEISINEEGVVNYFEPGAEEPQEAGQIELVDFANPAGLESIGQNLYSETAASGDPLVGLPAQDGYGAISQNFLEESNVEVVDEMVDMIAAQRAYETNSKSIQASDEMLQQANQLRR